MKTNTSMLALILMSVSPLALAGHDPDAVQMGSSRIDTNGDGWISREEFMAHEQELWDQMPKNSNGMVSTRDMPMRRDKMIRSGGAPMPNESMQSDQAKQDKVKPTEANGQ